jgi:hypothetical protein
MSNQNLDVAGLVLGLGFLGTLIALDNNRQENFTDNASNSSYPTYPQNPMFYAAAQKRANAMMAQQNNFQNDNVSSNVIYGGPLGGVPQNQTNINLNASGDQLLGYQMYQQAINAATPTQQQLDSISGDSQQQTGNDSPLQGGVSSAYAPYNVLGNSEPNLYMSEYQAVNLGNGRADVVSSCGANEPTFLSTSLLPKPDVPGSESWSPPTEDILATQNFLSAIQQIGVDTVSNNLRNASHDLRNNIPNSIGITGIWNQSTIDPDLSRRPLDCYIPQFDGLYGCGPAGCNSSGTYVGLSSSAN